MPTVPIVPTQELQGGGFQPFSTGGAIEPVRNFAGAQAKEMGAQMVNAGQVLGSIASKMQDEMDDASTKQADVAFLERAQGILRGENGYLNTLGAGAADVSSVNAALTEAQKEVEKGLTNDVQRLMFRQATARHMLTFKNQISEHRVTQTRQYAAGESNTRADRYSLEAANNFDTIGMVDANGAPTGPYEVALRTALQEANAAADLAMLPADSEQRKAMVRDVYGKVASGVVTNMMSSGRFLEAKSYIDKIVKEGQVDGDTALRLTNAIDAGYDKQRGIEIGEAIYSGQTVGGKPADDDYRNAITTIVPGAEVKPTDRRIPIATGTQPGRQPLQLEGVKETLIDNWELVQGDFGRAVPIVSGKRDAATNAKAGGANKSQHLDGNAIDVDTSSMSKEDRIRLIKMAAARGFTGIGVYENSLHFDMRAGGPAMWGPSHKADSVPEWARGLQGEMRGGGAAAGNGRQYHVPNTSGDGFRSIDVTPIRGMAINDFVKLIRSQGLEVTDILDQSNQEGAEPVWHMAVKLPSQMMGAREGGVKVPTGPDGKKDLPAMEAAIKAAGLDPDQEAVALQTVRARYTVDEQRETEAYKSLFEQAAETAFKRVGGWQDIDPITWGKLKQEDKAKLMEQVRGSDPDTVLKFLDDPLLGKKGTIEQYRHLLSESDYQRFYAAANGPEAEVKIREATIDADMFNATLNRNGLTSLTGAKEGTAEKEQEIEFRSKFKVLIDAEQTRLKRSLSMPEKQAILDGMLIDKAFVDRWGADGVSTPVLIMSPDDMKNAYVVVGQEEVRLAQIPAGERAKITEALRMRGMPATEQAIAELWVKAGKPR